MTVGHYENFPVASVLCPPAMRGAVTAIYHFARTADDIADEGEASMQVRLTQLRRYRHALMRCVDGQAPSPDDWPQVFGALGPQIAHHDLPVHLLTDLLDAFEQDTGNPVYADRQALLDYCRRSANPVGRLMLHLAGVHDPHSLQQSDAICTALQLINFWQDLSVDLPRGRHYIPSADAAAHGLPRTLLQAGQDSVASQALVRSLCDWARQTMLGGAPLALRVPGRLGWELRLVVQGGLRIIERIAAMDFRTFSGRPTLGGTDLGVMVWRAWRMGLTITAPGLQQG